MASSQDERFLAYLMGSLAFIMALGGDKTADDGGGTV